jgi:hypothetical protein
MRAPFLRLVAGTALAGQLAPEQPAPRRKERAPYRDRKPIEYHDGLPIVDPAGEADPIFSKIAKHRRRRRITTVVWTLETTRRAKSPRPNTSTYRTIRATHLS